MPKSKVFVYMFFFFFIPVLLFINLDFWCELLNFVDITCRDIRLLPNYNGTRSHLTYGGQRFLHVSEEGVQATHSLIRESLPN